MAQLAILTIFVAMMISISSQSDYYEFFCQIGVRNVEKMLVQLGELVILAFLYNSL